MPTWQQLRSLAWFLLGMALVITFLESLNEPTRHRTSYAFMAVGCCYWVMRLLFMVKKPPDA